MNNITFETASVDYSNGSILYSDGCVRDNNTKCIMNTNKYNNYYNNVCVFKRLRTFYTPCILCNRVNQRNPVEYNNIYFVRHNSYNSIITIR